MIQFRKIMYSLVLVLSLSLSMNTINAANVQVDTITQLETQVNSATEDSVITLSSSFPTTLTQSIQLTPAAFNITIDGDNKTLNVLNDIRHINLTKTGSKIFTIKNVTLNGNLVWNGVNPQIADWNVGGGIDVQQTTAGTNTLSNVKFTNIKNSALKLTTAGNRIVINNCLFQDNASKTSGAIFSEAGSNSLVIKNSSFINNGGNYNGGYPGGAIYVKNLASFGSFTVDNTYFEGNYNHTTLGGVTGGGGAIAIYNARNYSSTKINNSYFKKNVANRNMDISDLGDGGAIAALDLPASASFNISNSTFDQNVAADDGGALLIQQVTTNTSTLTNNTFYKNVAYGKDGKTLPGLSGGAIQIFNNNGTAPKTNFISNTFYGNEAYDHSTQEQRGGAIASSSNSLTFSAVSASANLFLDNLVKTEAGTDRVSLYSNVFSYNTTKNEDNIGFDNGVATTFNLENVFGGFVPKLAAHSSNVSAGTVDNAVKIPTIMIVPRMDTTGLANDAVTTLSNTAPLDERGFTRNATTRDIGAVEIYNINYNGNGASWTLSQLTEYDGITYYKGANPSEIAKIEQPGLNHTVISSTNLTRNGYTFKEWNTKEDGSGTTYNPNDVIENIQNDNKLYAIWIAKEPETEYVKVIFNKNSTTAINGNITQQTIEKNSSIALDSKLMGNPTNSGYTFVAWCTTIKPCKNVSLKAANISGSIFTKDTIVTKDTTVYAQWTKNKLIDPDGPKPKPLPDGGSNPIYLIVTLLTLITLVGVNEVKKNKN